MKFYDFEYWPYDKYGTKEERLWNLSQVPKEWAEEEPNKVCIYPYYDAQDVDMYRIELEAEDQYNAVFIIQELLDKVTGIPPYLSGLGHYQITFSEDTDEDGYIATWEMREIGDYSPPYGLCDVVYMDKLDHAINVISFGPYQAFARGMKFIEDYVVKEKRDNEIL